VRSRQQSWADYRPKGGILVTNQMCQNWLDPGHLVIVRGGSHVHQYRLREAGENGETNNAGDQEKDLFGLERMDAYKNHSNYGSYEQ